MINETRGPTLAILLTAIASAAFPAPAAAYVGPGAGLTVIGAALALVGSIVLGLFGFVWYPLKRLFRRRSSGSEAS